MLKGLSQEGFRCNLRKMAAMRFILFDKVYDDDDDEMMMMRVSCRVMLCRVVSCHVVSCHVVSRRVASRRVVSCHVMFTSCAMHSDDDSSSASHIGLFAQ